MLKVIVLTTRYNTKNNVKFKTNKIDNIKIIYNFLIIVNEIKKFSNWIVFFSIDIILKKNRNITSIEFKVQNAIDILNSFIIFDNYKLAKCLNLIKQKIDNYIT